MVMFSSLRATLTFYCQLCTDVHSKKMYSIFLRLDDLCIPFNSILAWFINQCLTPLFDPISGTKMFPSSNLYWSPPALFPSLLGLYSLLLARILLRDKKFPPSAPSQLLSTPHLHRPLVHSTLPVLCINPHSVYIISCYVFCPTKRENMNHVMQRI